MKGPVVEVGLGVLHIEAGQPHGEWELFYDDGAKRAKGRYAKGRRHGRWDWWRWNGEPLVTRWYERGRVTRETVAERP